MENETRSVITLKFAALVLAGLAFAAVLTLLALAVGWVLA